MSELWQDGVLNLQQIDDVDKDTQAILLEELMALIRAAMLGFDITHRMVDLTDQLLNGSASVATSANPSIWNRFIACLEMFADSSQLLDRHVLLDLDATATNPANSAFYEFCRQHHDESPLECVNEMLTKALSWYQIDAIKADDWLR